MGTRLAEERCRRASLISTGPVAQLRPTTSTCMALSTVRAAAISVPGSMRPVSSIVTWTWSGHDPVERGHGPAGAVDGRLGRQQVEDGLDQEEVDATFEQPERLLLVGVPQVGVGDLAEGGELGARSHAAGHPAWALGRGELGGDGLGDLGAGAADLTGPVGQPVLGQHDGGGAERAGLDDVAADLEERPVDLGDEVGAGADQDLVATLEVGAAEVLGAQAQHLQIGAHGAVEDEHPLPQGLEVGGCGRVETAEQFRGASTWCLPGYRRRPGRPVPAPIASDRDDSEDLHQDRRRRDDRALFRRACAQGFVPDRDQRRGRRGPGGHGRGPGGIGAGIRAQ